MQTQKRGGILSAFLPVAGIFLLMTRMQPYQNRLQRDKMNSGSWVQWQEVNNFQGSFVFDSANRIPIRPNYSFIQI